MKTKICFLLFLVVAGFSASNQKTTGQDAPPEQDTEKTVKELRIIDRQKTEDLNNLHDSVSTKIDSKGNSLIKKVDKITEVAKKNQKEFKETKKMLSYKYRSVEADSIQPRPAGDSLQIVTQPAPPEHPKKKRKRFIGIF